MSYFEIETQLLTFRKDILPYEFAYHLVFPNRNVNKKVDRGDWGVKLCRICLAYPKKLLPLHIIEVFAEFLPGIT